jgi:hypothetical protein
MLLTIIKLFHFFGGFCLRSCPEIGIRGSNALCLCDGG